MIFVLIIKQMFVSLLAQGFAIGLSDYWSRAWKHRQFKLRYNNKMLILPRLGMYIHYIKASLTFRNLKYFENLIKVKFR